MVGTRNHPKDFPAPTESPTKRTTRSSTASTSATTAPTANHTAPQIPRPMSTSSESSSSPIKARSAAAFKPSIPRRSFSTWSHSPPAFALPWLVVSLPLVLWDTGYIMLRPHTFPGGSLAWPLYGPYELYGRVDPVYSPEAYYSGLGWTGAQGLGNVFETLAYLVYAWIIVKHGSADGRREGGAWGLVGGLAERRRVEGWWGAVASLVGYTTFVITVMKSVLYWYNDAFMGFPLFRQNNWFNLIFVFAIPNAAWIVVPTYLSYLYVIEIMDGLLSAAGTSKKER